MKRRIEVTLSEQEEKLVKWMAKRDDVTFAEELKIIFNSEMYHCMELYEDEMEADRC